MHVESITEQSLAMSSPQHHFEVAEWMPFYVTAEAPAVSTNGLWKIALRLTLPGEVYW